MYVIILKFECSRFVVIKTLVSRYKHKQCDVLGVCVKRSLASANYKCFILIIKHRAGLIAKFTQAPFQLCLCENFQITNQI